MQGTGFTQKREHQLMIMGFPGQSGNLKREFLAEQHTENLEIREDILRGDYLWICIFKI